MGKMSKPWLNYHKPGAPVREYHPKKHKPRQLIWARMWLLSGLHRFYLRQPWKGILLIFGLLVLNLFSAIWMDKYPDEPSRIQLMISFVPMFTLYAIEYFRLPGLVRDANIKTFGKRAKTVPEMQGLIGEYAALRPVVLCFITTYMLIQFGVVFSWPSWVLFIVASMNFIATIVFLIQIVKITKRRKLGKSHDRP